jgi:hypothetical protein
MWSCIIIIIIIIIIISHADRYYINTGFHFPHVMLTNLAHTSAIFVHREIFFRKVGY